MLLAVGIGLPGCQPGDAGPDAARLVAHDRAVGLMGQHDFVAAEAAFAEVVGAAPDWLDARVNLAIATLNRQREGDEARALEMLATVLQADPNHLRALYTSGILRFHGGDVAAATALFRAVTEADPEDAHAAYFLGQTLLQAGDNEAAARWFLTAVRLDANLVSAYYTGSLALRRLGRVEEALALLAEFEQRRPSPAARTAEIKYLRMGPKAEALALNPTPAPDPPAISGALLGASITAAEIGAPVATITVADVNHDGRLNLVAAGGDRVVALAGAGAAAGAGFAPVAGYSITAAAPVNGVLWGDVDEDGALDAVLCGARGVTLWQRSDGRWRSAAHLGEAPCAAAALFDADHDGDLDVFATGPQGAALYNNDRDGGFRRLGPETGLDGAAVAGRQVLVADLDGDRDLDIVVRNDQPPHAVWRNDRAWRYDTAAGFEDFKATALAALTVVDSDADGHRELYGADADGAISRWRQGGGRWRREEVLAASPPSDAAATPNAQLDVADFNGDGAPELLRVFGDELAIVDVQSGAVRWRDAVPGLTAARAVALHAAQGPSLVAAAGRGTLLVWPPGAGRHAFLALAPTGSAGDAPARSNASGIGTALRVRFGGRWSLHDALDPHSGPGQSLQPLSVGLGGRSQADFVALEWSDGVSQTELGLAAGQTHVIVETQRQLASCPVFFAWDGSRYRFVSDVLGGAALGYLVAPGEYAPPRPMEAFLLSDEALAARAGRYLVKLTEPMEENAYLDAAELDIWDLPPSWSMALDERLAASAPAATGRPIFYRRTAVPIKVTTADGRDVTALATRPDHAAVPPGRLDPRFIGRLAADQTLTLEFATPLDAPGAVLLADGWVEYPYSQTAFAAWQAGADYRAPTLEARAANGDWRELAAQFGYPAGMPRQIALALPPLPAGTRALRLSTNMEIYWDAIAVAFEEPLPGGAARPAPLLAARVARRGFAARTTGPQRLPHYDYAERSQSWDAKLARGFYTAFGDATELARARDGGLAIIGGGEEVHLEFEAAPPPPPGHTRHFVLRFHGWAKDMDLYTRDGDQVGPVPRPRQLAPALLARGARLNERHNVRFQDGL